MSRNLDSGQRRWIARRCTGGCSRAGRSSKRCRTCRNMTTGSCWAASARPAGSVRGVRARRQLSAGERRGRLDPQQRPSCEPVTPPSGRRERRGSSLEAPLARSERPGWDALPRWDSRETAAHGARPWRLVQWSSALRSASRCSSRNSARPGYLPLVARNSSIRSSREASITARNVACAGLIVPVATWIGHDHKGLDAAR